MLSIVNNSVSARYVKLIQTYLQNASFSEAEHKALDEIFLDRYNNFTGRVSFHEFEVMLKEAGCILGERPLGLEAGYHVHPSDFGIMGYALMNCETLRQALSFITGYKETLNNGIVIQLHDSGSVSRLKLNWETESMNVSTLVELDFVSVMQLSRYLVGSQNAHKIVVNRVNFKHSPIGDVERYQQIFKCPVCFNQAENQIVIPNEVFNLPIRSADPQMFKMYLRKIQRIQNRGQHEEALHRQVFIYVSNLESDKLPSIQSTSNYFNMSPSTLKKRLQSEGYNFSQICDSVRSSKAIKLVLSPTVHLKDICRTLGFSSPSAFNRAFKRWTSMTPVEYRRTKSQKLSA